MKKSADQVLEVADKLVMGGYDKIQQLQKSLITLGVVEQVVILAKLNATEFGFIYDFTTVIEPENH